MIRYETLVVFEGAGDRPLDVDAVQKMFEALAPHLAAGEAAGLGVLGFHITLAAIDPPIDPFVPRVER